VNFSVLDAIFILLIVVFALRCYVKGFVSELLSMSAIISGLLASLFFYKNGAEYLRAKFWPDLKTIPEIIAFVALFLIVYIIIKILDVTLKGIIQGIKLSGVDKFLGIIFGLAEGIAVISLVLFLLRIQPLFDPSSLLQDSIFARFLLPLITGKENIDGV
jgi:membrane protein required for colicin V production